MYTFSLGGAVEWWQGIGDPHSKVVSFPNQGMSIVGTHSAQDNRPGDFKLQCLSLILIMSIKRDFIGRPRIIIAQPRHHIPNTIMYQIKLP